MRDKVFLCYSHFDKEFLQQLLTHLKPLERSGRVSSWSDQQIQPGSKWFDDIKAALASAKVAVLLVTPQFLASNFIHDHELGPILIEAEKGRVQILWIPVRACMYEETALNNYQAVIPPDKPLAEMKAERDRAWVRVCQEIKKAASASTAAMVPNGVAKSPYMLPHQAALDRINEVTQAFEAIKVRGFVVPDHETRGFILLCETTVDAIAGSDSRFASALSDIKAAHATTLNAAHKLFYQVVENLKNHIQIGSD